MKYVVKVDKQKCIGCGACTNICDNFKMDADKAVPVKKELTEPGCSAEAQDICPVQAITVTKA
ncbi:MAG: ferredoxin [Candidatus Woesearchaeota archaeon]